MYCIEIATHSFPVEENAVIYSFIACIDDEREIVAEVKEKRIAQQEYNQALAQGHGAYLFEQDERSNDVFIVSVGAYVRFDKKQSSISLSSKILL